MKKRIIKISYTILHLCLLFFFVSCEKLNTTNEKKEQNVNRVTYYENQLDFIGIEHNGILTEFARLISISDSNGEFRNIIRYDLGPRD